MPSWSCRSLWRATRAVPTRVTRCRAPAVVAALGLSSAQDASAHVGGLEAAPLLGASFGFVAGLVIDLLPVRWRGPALGVALVVALAPIAVVIVGDAGFPPDIVSVLAWLALGFAFLLVPAGLAGLAGRGVARWMRATVRFWQRWR